MRPFRPVLFSALLLIGCTANGDHGNGAAQAQAEPQAQRGEEGRPFQVQPTAQFSEPWAMAFIPGTQQALITEQRGTLKLWSADGGETIEVAGVPRVDYGGQGGLGDVALHPDFANNHLVYLSYAEAGDGNLRGAAVGRGRLIVDNGQARIEDFEVIWRQQPKKSGRGHYGHRLLFSPDGRYLFISSGERQEFTPAQDMTANLGKVVRLNPDGSVPADNPFADRGGVTAQIWTLGHRNPLGLAWDADGRLWEIEMGPQGGDELNLIQKGSNYGYPIVSNGDHYDGRPIPDHDTHPEFAAPKVSWNPVISPGDMIIYSGNLFPEWRGDALVAGLSSQALIHVDLDGTNAREAERWPMGQRIREVEQAPNGSLYLIEDQDEGQGGRLLHLTPTDS